MWMGFHRLDFSDNKIFANFMYRKSRNKRSSSSKNCWFFHYFIYCIILNTNFATNVSLFSAMAYVDYKMPIFPKVTFLEYVIRETKLYEILYVFQLELWNYVVLTSRKLSWHVRQTQILKLWKLCRKCVKKKLVNKEIFFIVFHAK